jgi:hypothetical protein
MLRRPNIFLFVILLNLTSCSSDIHGLYSHCWGQNPKHDGCHYIELNKDGSFTYSDPFTISSNLTTKGQWIYRKNKLTLSYLGRNSLDSSKSEHGYPLIEIVRLEGNKIWIHHDTLTKRIYNSDEKSN